MEDPTTKNTIDDPCSSTTSSNNNTNVGGGPIYIMVIRHSERLDYVTRDTIPKGGNWCIGQECPYDPPLTDNGMKMGYQLGEYLQKDIISNNTNSTSSTNSASNTSSTSSINKLKNKLPPITAIYTSPFLRCRQTACNIRKGLAGASTGTSIAEPVVPTHIQVPPIRYEWGLCESINEDWYTSWSFPESDGTWGGYRRLGSNNNNNDDLHIAATVPIQQIIIPTIENRCINDIELDTSEQQQKSLSSIEQDYCYATNYVESSHDQRQRMVSTIDTIITKHLSDNTNINSTTSIGQTILFVSHGGPVTHLYEALSNNKWYDHGEATYCCYSIYKLLNNNTNTNTNNKSNDSIEKEDSTTATTTTTTTTTKKTALQMIYKWEPISVNQSIFDD